MELNQPVVGVGGGSRLGTCAHSAQWTADIHLLLRSRKVGRRKDVEGLTPQVNGGGWVWRIILIGDVGYDPMIRGVMFHVKRLWVNQKELDVGVGGGCRLGTCAHSAQWTADIRSLLRSRKVWKGRCRRIDSSDEW